MTTPNSNTNVAAPIQSVDRALQILEFLTEEPILSTSEIARRLGVHRSTASRLLATMEARNVVEQVADRGAYRLGLGLLRMAYPVSMRFDLARDSQAICDALADATQETTNVAILDGGYAVMITQRDRKSTRLNSSHVAISYAVFCLKKKK